MFSMAVGMQTAESALAKVHHVNTASTAITPGKRLQRVPRHGTKRSQPPDTLACLS